MGLITHETFVPQSYDWGVEAQVDWYDAYAELSGVRPLTASSCASIASKLGGTELGQSIVRPVCELNQTRTLSAPKTKKPPNPGGSISVIY